MGGEQIRKDEGARFLVVLVDGGLRWAGHIGQVKAKVGCLLGVLGRQWARGSITMKILIQQKFPSEKFAK